MITSSNKKITIGDKEIIVENVYPYMYTNGKVVLRISAKEENATEAELKQLKDNQQPIVYYEQETNEDGTVGTWTVKNTYEGYTTGEYVSSYADGKYSCEITRLGEMEKAVKQNTANIDYLSIMSGVKLYE